MDFYDVLTREDKKNVVTVYPSFRVTASKDLMIKGGAFHAVWVPEKGLWSLDEYDVVHIVDTDLYARKLELETQNPGLDVRVSSLQSEASNMWARWTSHKKRLPDTATQLDERVIFQNQEVKKSDYASKRLPYSLVDGPIDAYDELMSTLYAPEQRDKLEWAIGAVLAGEGKRIQKFCVLYGDAGSGKSTVLHIIEDLFEGYYSSFEARALGNSSSAFSAAAFSKNPLVAIQHDGDLSRIDDNTKLNSIIAHEDIMINEKYKSGYPMRVNSFLFMGTNKPVKITDAKSGLLRRLIDIEPTGNRIPADRYQILMDRIKFEHGSIANHCLNKFHAMGKHYYDAYRPLSMAEKTDYFYTFVEEYYDVFKLETEGITLKRAWQLYKEHCVETAVRYPLSYAAFRDELDSYFEERLPRARIDGEAVRNLYVGFDISKFESKLTPLDVKPSSISLDSKESLLDEMLKDCPAQYATETETPEHRWDNVTTTLSDIDTGRLHYVRPPENHIVIDFDLKGSDGQKSLEQNIFSAENWIPTYAETSKSGSGLHLHYIYDGDVSALRSLYAEGIEIKVFSGKASLRRKVIRCNDIPVATLGPGSLPLKEKDKVLDNKQVSSEKSLREQITRNLRKEIHPGTKPSIDFIKRILDDAYASDLTYDVTDMRPAVLSFANNSTNQSAYCVKLVPQMKFASEAEIVSKSESEKPLVFFDIEVFPNLFVVVYKPQDGTPVRMINPTGNQITELVTNRLVGFNNRLYDNHILYARILGYTNEQLYKLSQSIINSKDRRGMFGAAYDLSYADVYDFVSKKQSLKLYEIELGLKHVELPYAWDEPVPEKNWEKVAEYCENDVIATQAVFEARHADFVARQLLMVMSKLPFNKTTNQHTTQIVFDGDKNPQQHFTYYHLGTGEDVPWSAEN